MAEAAGVGPAGACTRSWLATSPLTVRIASWLGRSRSRWYQHYRVSRFTPPSRQGDDRTMNRSVAMLGTARRAEAIADSEGTTRFPYPAVPPVGADPTTCRLKGECSAVELRRQMVAGCWS
jgi:hypothetical protein